MPGDLSEVYSQTKLFSFKPNFSFPEWLQKSNTGVRRTFVVFNLDRVCRLGQEPRTCKIPHTCWMWNVWTYTQEHIQNTRHYKTDKRFFGGFHKLRPKFETVTGTDLFFLLVGVGNQTLYFDMYSVRFFFFLLVTER